MNTTETSTPTKPPVNESRKPSFDKPPICEVCRKKRATSFSYFKAPPITTYTLHAKRQGLKGADEDDEPRTYTPADLRRILLNPDVRAAHWCFCCDCTRESEDYYIMIDRFFRSAGSVTDWLSHLHEKTWFVATDFLDMLHRFREATGSFHKC